MNTPSKASWRWLWRMAWRDTRRSRSRLFLFISAIVLGIAALVAIQSLKYTLEKEIGQQAATLLGADLEISDNKPLPPDIRKMADSLSDRQSEERGFSSMIYFPATGGSRLVQVRALRGDFPYYGQLETLPESAAMSFRDKQEALVDETLLLQLGAKTGDSVQVGNLTFGIAGSLKGAPGQSGISASVAPVVYIPLQYLPATGLEQKGSRIIYRQYLKFDRPVDMEKLIAAIEPRLEAAEVNFETVASQEEDSLRSFTDVARFLTLTGFIALLLGCMGVASAIHIYIRGKMGTIAVLRCLGAKSSQAFLIYLIQMLGIGLLGSLAGAALGVAVQQLLPLVLADLLPVRISPALSWVAIGQGIVLGMLISFLFAMLPLVSVRNISPLFTLRMAYEHRPLRDPLKWVLYLLIGLFIFGFAAFQMENWRRAAGFTIGVLTAFLVLSGMALLLMYTVRRFFPASWSYLWRQGLANLYRPNNQTSILIVSVGLGTALICTLFFVQDILLTRVTLSSSGHQPNMVLFDIQTGQKDRLDSLARSKQLPVLGMVPIVTMRLESINEVNAARLKADSTLPMQRWVFTREYRVTFRDSLTSSEQLTQGKFTGKVDPNDGRIYVSVEERFAKRNGINIGDTMTFNVQGALMPTVVSSFRKVDWNRVQTNFLVVFPTGVLEAAPQFHVLLTRVPSAEVSAAFQQDVVRQFPNVSVIDLNLILRVLDDILSKIGFVIRFMAGFSILTGLMVLFSSVLISKYQRVQESVLLRTLGASRKQILVITALEYLMLGMLAAAAGIVLALGASWALAVYVFETDFSPHGWPVVLVFVSVVSITVGIGLFNIRALLSKPPLEILRQEV